MPNRAPTGPSPSTVVVGAGPNGLATGIVMALAGMPVTIYEGRSTLGGGVRSAALTLPGFRHDICSSVYPLGPASPFFQALPLAQLGLSWIQPDLHLAHPFDDGSAACLHSDLPETARELAADGPRWLDLFGPAVRHWPEIAAAVLGPLAFPPPRIPVLRFGLAAFQSCTRLVRTRLQTDRARALFTGLAGHGMVPLDGLASAAFGLVLGSMAHIHGWPFARGGAQSITRALQRLAVQLGIQIRADTPITDWQELADFHTRILDMGPHQIARLTRAVLPARARRRLQAYRYGPGICKVDYALSEPVPWLAEECRRAGTVHLGGNVQAIRSALDGVWSGTPAARPFVIASQPSLFDAARAPAGKHVLWAYCHVPHGCPVDASTSIEAQIERFAPGFRETVLHRHVHRASDWPAYNPNYVGGDINGGLQDLRQLWRRPLSWRDPYRLPTAGLYICSSSTPPGGGVHGMCGLHAACSALRHDYGMSWTLEDVRAALEALPDLVRDGPPDAAASAPSVRG